MGTERRIQTALGRKRRRDFERSVHKLRELGMPEWAVEYYRRAARVAGLPPHMVVCHVAVVAAGRQMQSTMEHSLHLDAPDTAPGHGEAAGTPGDGPSYGAVTEMRRRVNDLWREIQKHGERNDVGENPFGAREPQPEDLASGKVTVLRPAPPEDDRPSSRPRGRKSPAKGY